MGWKVLLGSLLVFGFFSRGIAQEFPSAAENAQMEPLQDWGFGTGGGAPMSSAQAVQLTECQKEMKTATDTYNSATNTIVQKCGEQASHAGYGCIERYSSLKELAAFASGFLNMVNTKGYANACSSGKKAMVYLKDGLTAFNLACGGLQWRCQDSCKIALKTISTSQATITTMQTTYNTAKGKIESAIIKCKHSCDGYTKNLLAGGLGVVNLIQRVNDNSKCEEELKVTVIDCAVKANFQNQKCICERTPQLPGCPGNVASSGSSTSTTSAVTASTDLKNLNVDANLSGSNLPTDGGGGARGSGSGGSPAASNAGNNAGVAGSGGSGSSGAKALQKSGSADGGKGGLNTNVLSGEYGGGGGGGGRGSGGGSNDPSSSAYRSYMPGGDKDPSRNIASQNQQAEQVTGAGGSDNWHKVSDRYKNHRSSLKGE